MITAEEVIRIGTLRKAYGTRGEILCNIDVDWAEQVFEHHNTLATERCIILKLDGIFVPFFIDSYRWRQEGLLIHFDENYLPVQGEAVSRRLNQFIGSDIYILRKDLPADFDDEDWDITDYTILDQHNKIVGTVSDVDTTTANTLIILHNGAVLPFHEDLVLSVDEDNKTIQMIIPEGLI